MAEPGRAVSEPGRVVSLEANFCRVDLDRPGPDGQNQLLCTRRTRLAKGGLSIAVGDRVEVEGIDAREAARLSDGGLAALAGARQIFHGSIAENIHLGRPTVTDADVRESLRKVLAWEEVLKLPEGVETMLLTGGRPLSAGQIDRLMIARAIAGLPRVLVLDGALDALPIEIRQGIWDNLTQPKTSTIIVITNEPDIIQRCDKVVNLSGLGSHGESGNLDSSHAFA